MGLAAIDYLTRSTCVRLRAIPLTETTELLRNDALSRALGLRPSAKSIHAQLWSLPSTDILDAPSMWKRIPSMQNATMHERRKQFWLDSTTNELGVLVFTVDQAIIIVGGTSRSSRIILRQRKAQARAKQSGAELRAGRKVHCTCADGCHAGC
eukprot:scaffold244_cov172-Amphora_coffeaeformis.AAC.55